MLRKSKASEMGRVEGLQERCWYSIIWFLSWGVFQAYAVTALLIGSWRRPDVFPAEAYRALIFPDLLFVPIYMLSAVLLYLRSPAGVVFGLLAGGAVTYVMVYLLALARFSGAENLAADGLFLLLNVVAVIQLSRTLNRSIGQPRINRGT